MNRRGFFGTIAAWLAGLKGASPSVPPPTQEDWWARKGEIVTCENGHSICEVGTDILFGTMQNPAHLINWTQPQPAMGTPREKVPPCAICGARWWNADRNVYGDYHFPDGWR